MSTSDVGDVVVIFQSRSKNCPLSEEDNDDG